MKDFTALRKSLPPASRSLFDEGLRCVEEALHHRDPRTALAILWMEWSRLYAEMAQPQPPMTPEETIAAVSAIARVPNDDQMRAIEFLGKHYGLIVERKFTASKQERTVRVIYESGEVPMLVDEPSMPLLEAGNDVER